MAMPLSSKLFGPLFQGWWGQHIDAGQRPRASPPVTAVLARLRSGPMDAGSAALVRYLEDVIRSALPGLADRLSNRLCTAGPFRNLPDPARGALPAGRMHTRTEAGTFLALL